VIVIKIAKEAVNKSNRPIQNPLLLVMEPQTRDNMMGTGIAILGGSLNINGIPSARQDVGSKTILPDKISVPAYR
jgi:hypothetical protein